MYLFKKNSISFISKTFYLAIVFICASLSVLAQNEKEDNSPFIDTVAAAIDSIATVVESPATDDFEDEEKLPADFLHIDSFRYSDMPFTMRNLPKNLADSVKKEKEYWYADYDFKKNKKRSKVDSEDDITNGSAKGKKGSKKNEDEGVIINNEERSSGSVWFSNFLWVLIIAAFVGVLIWFLASGDLRIFGKKKVVITENHEEEISDNIFEIKYDRELLRAESESNYRLAIRLLFLRLLKDMDSRQLINYKHEKTNFDYLADLYNTTYYRTFFSITRNYEFAWYGKFDISQEKYNIIKKEITDFSKERGLI